MAQFTQCPEHTERIRQIALAVGIATHCLLVGCAASTQRRAQGCLVDGQDLHSYASERERIIYWEQLRSAPPLQAYEGWIEGFLEFVVERPRFILSVLWESTDAMVHQLSYRSLRLDPDALTAVFLSQGIPLEMLDADEPTVARVLLRGSRSGHPFHLGDVAEIREVVIFRGGRLLGARHEYGPGSARFDR